LLTLTFTPLAVPRACAGSSGSRCLEEEINVSRKLGLTAAAATMALALAACGGEGAGSGSGGGGDAEDQSIGVSMPTQTSERWIADGNSVKE
jgi:hypothetical protein